MDEPELDYAKKLLERLNNDDLRRVTGMIKELLRTSSAYNPTPIEYVKFVVERDEPEQVDDAQ